ncbi:MAG: gamma-glutamyl-gamma-aminobutyrate hydrolase family protein [Pseudomonadota bacterium]
MIIGIIETGRPPAGLQDNHGSYPSMIESLLSKKFNALSFKYVSVLDVLPDNAKECDAWMITGSSHGVYENLPWMQDLTHLIRSAVEQRVPVVGICFGHQIMAQALGGKVIQSDKGWGLGLATYEVAHHPEWIKEKLDSIVLPASHQDQVVELPAGAKVLASSAFCPYAALVYDDVALSFQGHPEFNTAFLRALIESRRERVDANTLDTALTSIDQLEASNSASLVADWIGAFLTKARA